MSAVKYSNTIIAGVIAVLGLVTVAAMLGPTNPYTGLIVGAGLTIVIPTLLGIRQSEANGHRLTAVETTADKNTAKIIAGTKRQDATDVATGVVTSADPPTQLRNPSTNGNGG